MDHPVYFFPLLCIILVLHITEAKATLFCFRATYVWHNISRYFPLLLFSLPLSPLILSQSQFCHPAFSPDIAFFDTICPPLSWKPNSVFGVYKYGIFSDNLPIFQMLLVQASFIVLKQFSSFIGVVYLNFICS